MYLNRSWPTHDGIRQSSDQRKSGAVLSHFSQPGGLNTTAHEATGRGCDTFSVVLSLGRLRNSGTVAYARLSMKYMKHCVLLMTLIALAYGTGAVDVPHPDAKPGLRAVWPLRSRGAISATHSRWRRCSSPRKISQTNPCRESMNSPPMFASVFRVRRVQAVHGLTRLTPLR